jgi:hypothetical protein
MLWAGLAQLVEHLICNQGVGDSSSSTGTSKINDLAKCGTPLSLFLASFFGVSGNGKASAKMLKYGDMKRTMDRKIWRIEPLPAHAQQVLPSLAIMEERMPVIRF